MVKLEIFRYVLVFTGPSLAAATFPIIQHAELTQDIHGHGPSAILENIVTGLDIHRELRGKKKKRKCDSKDFACLPHSEPRREVSCHEDPIEDCECNLGYRRNSDGDCVATEGLCSEDYFEGVFAMIDNVDSYVNKVYASEDNPDERYGYYQQMEISLSDAWEAYNRGKASCEVELGDDFLEDDFGEGRMLLRERQLFGRRIAKAFKSVKKAVVKVAKAVVKAVVSTVQTVVDVVVEIVECGVGIATDGLKCGLIGCAFGLVGVALDIAFTVATGGANKAATAACSVVEVAAGDVKSAEKDPKSNASQLVPILLGIGSTICIVNTKLEDKTLGTVCNVFKQAEKVENGLVIAQMIDPISFKLLETFRNAMCGNPGSAIFNLVEEVVSCFIGCSQDNNAFCPAGDEPKAPPKTEAPEIDTTTTTVPESEDAPAVEYEGFLGKACRNSKGKPGSDGDEFQFIKDISESACETKCSDSASCKGWEYSKDRCEIWHVEPAKFSRKSNIDCFVKLDTLQ